MRYLARTISALGLAAALATHPLAAQQLPAAPFFTTLDFPGATTTQLWCINGRGESVGFYISADSTHHGFLLVGSRFTSIDFPGASLTEVYGINGQGDVVGTYMTTGTVTHGFVLSGGRFTTTDFPGASYTGPAGINARGEVQGLYTLNGVNHGFLQNGSDFTTVDYPGADFSGINGFNESGDLVGNYSVAGIVRAYLFHNGSFTSIEYPGAPYTGAYGINAIGEIAGRYRDAAGVTHGYLLSAGKFSVFDFPGATFTGGDGIGANGDIIGRYTLGGITHGFLLQRGQQPRYTVTDLGTLGGTYSTAYGINNAGVVGGAASLVGENQHPFLWTKGKLTDLGTLGGPNAAATNATGAGIASIVSETSKTDPLNEDFCGYGTHLICLAAFGQNGKMTALPTLGGNNAIGFVVNERGQMAGVAETATHDTTCAAPQVLAIAPVIWGPNPGDIRALPLLPGDTNGFALGINDKGEAVGSTGTCQYTSVNATGLNSGQHAVLWQNGVAIDVGSFGDKRVSVAGGINNRTEVVGGSILNNEMDVHGFLWTRETGVQEIGTVGADTSSIPTWINNNRQIVGGSCDSDGDCRAFLWENDVMTDLNDLTSPDSQLQLVFGGSINDVGEIVGTAVNKSTGELHAFLASPSANGPAVSTSGLKTVLPPHVREKLQHRVNLGGAGRR